MARHTFAITLVCVLLLSAAPFALAQTASFQPLGLGPGGVQSFAWDASSNGAVVVGSYWVQDPNGFSIRQLGFRWEAGVFSDLGALNPNAREVQALAVSDNGTKVVGWSRAVSGFQRPFLWTSATGMQELSNVPGTDAIASDISPDGNVVVGYFSDSAGSHAFLWNAGVVTVMSSLPNGFDTKSQAVCGVGASLVGSALNSNFTEMASRWSSNGSVQLLPQLAGAETSYAEGCSNDGTAVIGASTDSKGNLAAVRWDSAGARSLGALGGSSSEAHAISGDGNIVVGGAGLPPVAGVSDFSAFRWLKSTGKMEQLSRTLQSAGVGTPFCHQTPCAAGTWFLQLALGVSSDGSAIVGTAQDPNGNLQAYRAIVPVAGTPASPAAGNGACPSGFTQVTLSVNTGGASGSVSSTQNSASGSRLTVASGQTGSACFRSNQTLGFQAANARLADWGGTPNIICKNRNTNQNSCSFQLGSASQGVTSSLH